MLKGSLSSQYVILLFVVNSNHLKKTRLMPAYLSFLAGHRRGRPGIIIIIPLTNTGWREPNPGPGCQRPGEHIGSEGSSLALLSCWHGQSITSQSSCYTCHISVTSQSSCYTYHISVTSQSSYYCWHLFIAFAALHCAAVCVLWTLSVSVHHLHDCLLSFS